MSTMSNVILKLRKCIDCNGKRKIKHITPRIILILKLFKFFLNKNAKKKGSDAEHRK